MGLRFCRQEELKVSFFSKEGENGSNLVLCLQARRLEESRNARIWRKVEEYLADLGTLQRLMGYSCLCRMVVSFMIHVVSYLDNCNGTPNTSSDPTQGDTSHKINKVLAAHPR